MTTYKNRYLVSAFLFVLIVLATMNILNCGGGGNNAPVIFGISQPIGVENLTKPCTFTSPGGVTINGANFGAKQGTSYVTFDNYNAGAATSWSDTSIIINAPANGTPQASDPRATFDALGYYYVPVPVVVNVNYLTSNAVTYTYSVTCK